MKDSNGNQYDGWVVENPRGFPSAKPGTTRKKAIHELIGWYASGSGFRREWKRLRRQGFRCVKVLPPQVVRRYTKDYKFVDSEPVGGVYIERLRDGTVWLRVGGAKMRFIARKRGVFDWHVDEIGEGVEVEK